MKERQDKQGFMAEQKQVNTDQYGARIVKYAEDWANLMEGRIDAGEKLVDIADSTSREANTDRIPGFMYGAAVSILSSCWEHGEELRRWHNGEFGEPEIKGVVNPAMLIIK